MLGLRSLRPTEVFDTYWTFAAERQRVYFARVHGRPPPWTVDPIIGEYRFTNPYRAADRVSQYLIREVIYGRDAPRTPEDVLFRILLFKVFNKIETWQLLEERLGPISYSGYDFARFDAVLTEALACGRSIYSAAYIMPPGGTFGHGRKHRNHLDLLESMMRSSLALQLSRARSMGEAFDLLRGFPTIGDFLAYQYVTDINYSELLDFPEDDFVVAGPGAIDGICKCFARTAGWSDSDVIRLVAESQEDEFARVGESFPDLFGRPLQYIDCQNLFCEVDKYARVAHPHHRGRSGRSRIKQKFSDAGPVPAPWFPPKWGINDQLPEAPQ